MEPDRWNLRPLVVSPSAFVDPLKDLALGFDPLKDLALGFDREWENLKKRSFWLFKGTEIGGDWFEAFCGTPSVSKRASSGSGNSNSNVMEPSFWKPPSPKHRLFLKNVHPEDHLWLPPRGEPNKLKLPFSWEDVKSGLWEWQKTKTEGKAFSVRKWEPLRQLRVSLMELETAADSSTTPEEFFQNLNKAEFFADTKTSLKLGMLRADGVKGQHVNADEPFDVLELLEYLIEQAEHLMDQLGVKKGFTEKICATLQNWKCHNVQSALLPSVACMDVSNLSKEAGKAVDELDLKIARVLQSKGYEGNVWGQRATFKETQDNDSRHIAIFTTASLPWMTGTSINPLFRAAYLAKSGKRNVTLVVPWLCKKDQEQVYPNQVSFSSPEEQERYIYEWLETRVNFKPNFKIVFYPGKFSKEKRSILAVGDITECISNNDADIAILEEPEHLTWYHHGKRWTWKFCHVVGIVHTNYLEYVKREKNGALQALLLKYVNNWVTNIYCHKVVRLSAATQKLPRSVICNVHGVNPKFLEIGQKLVEAEEENAGIASLHGAYYLGKMIWGKGYRELIDLLAKHKQHLQGLKVDVYGSGEDSIAVRNEARKFGIEMDFHEGRDHADISIQRYKVFINPSLSDVVCTTTAEALAMGKFVVCADHPSNEFFKSFPNCLMYRTSDEFVERVKEAMGSKPVALTPEQQYILSWEAATERFTECADLHKIPPKAHKQNGSNPVRRRKGVPRSLSMPNLRSLVDESLFVAHYYLSGIEVARLASGAPPGTLYVDEEQSRDLGLSSPPSAVSYDSSCPQ